MTNDTKELWAWMTEYPDGTIGMVGMMLAGNHTPLIGRSEKHIRVLEPAARAHHDQTGQRVWLRRFHDCTDEADLETIG